MQTNMYNLLIAFLFAVLGPGAAAELASGDSEPAQTFMEEEEVEEEMVRLIEAIRVG